MNLRLNFPPEKGNGGKSENFDRQIERRPDILAKVQPIVTYKRAKELFAFFFKIGQIFKIIYLNDTLCFDLTDTDKAYFR